MIGFAASGEKGKGIGADGDADDVNPEIMNSWAPGLLILSGVPF